MHPNSRLRSEFRHTPMWGIVGLGNIQGSFWSLSTFYLVEQLNHPRVLERATQPISDPTSCAFLFFPSTAGAWEPPAQRTRARFCHPSAEVSGKLPGFGANGYILGIPSVNVLVSPGVPRKIELERKKTSHFYFFTTISGENTTIVGGISSYILPSSPHFNKQSVRGGIGNSFFNLNNMKKHLILPKHRIYVVLKPCVTPLIDNPIYSLSSASLSFCLIPLPGHWKRLGMTSFIGCTYIYISYLG